MKCNSCKKKLKKEEAIIWLGKPYCNEWCIKDARRNHKC